MRIKLGAFPAAYFTAKCSRHDCVVGVAIKGSTDRTNQHTIGGQILALECQKGGPATSAACTDKWELSVSGTGDITITQ